LDKNTYTSVLTELLEGLGGTAKLPNSAGYELIDELRSNQSVTRVSLAVILLTQPTQINDTLVKGTYVSIAAESDISIPPAALTSKVHQIAVIIPVRVS